MATMLPVTRLRGIQALSFDGKGEASVEQLFVTPLLECLGYESHKDYEVSRHGDAGASFRLNYPPVERGAQRVKEYNPDYMPTIRKKMFWIIEAKSARNLQYPFAPRFLVQGFQYCIHPDIQAKYLFVTNADHSAVYDVHGMVFRGGDMYEPILEFALSELTAKWDAIFNLLSVEKLRTRIEDDLQAMYNKLCLSSLDRNYPHSLLARIGASVGENARHIEEHVRALLLEDLNREDRDWHQEMDSLDAEGVFALMDRPLRRGPRQEGASFVEKSLAAGMPAIEIAYRLTEGFDEWRVLRKLQSFNALCHVYQRTDDDATRSVCEDFFKRYKDAELPLLTQVECASMRVTRKVLVVDAYPLLRQRLEDELKSAAELVRFVRRPTALQLTYTSELALNRSTFKELEILAAGELQCRLEKLLLIESKIDDAYRDARKELPDSEKQLVIGFENYGVGGKLFQFAAMLTERGIELD